MHLLKSFGSTPGRALMSRGSMWVGPSGKRCPPDTRLRATPIMQLRVAVSWWGSVRVSRAGYVLRSRQKTVISLCSFQNVALTLIRSRKLATVVRIVKKQNLGDRFILEILKLTSPARGEWPTQASLERDFAGPVLHQDCPSCWTWPAGPAGSCSPQSLLYSPLWACDCLVLVLATWAFCSALGGAGVPRWPGDAGAASWVSSGHEDRGTVRTETCHTHRCDQPVWKHMCGTMCIHVVWTNWHNGHVNTNQASVLG